MPLELANPTRLWWALLAIPIIALFILRVRLRRRQVSTLLFWDQLFEEHPPRAWWRRLRNLIALALQLAFLGLVVAALVDPLWAWQKRDARQIVYVIDNSASMSARDEAEAQPRFERVRAAARRMIASLRQHDTAAVVTAGGLPNVAIGMTADVRILGETIDSIVASDGPTRLAEAVELARRLVADEEKREIIVLTDGADDDVTELNSESDVTVFGFGKKTGNTAITCFQVRRNIADATSYQVLVEVTHFGDEPVECRLDLELEGNVVDVIPLQLAPREPWRQTLDHTSPAGGRLVAKLDVEDALATDNEAIAVLPHRAPIPVLLVTPGSLFLRSVFESIPNVELTVVEAVPEKIPAGTITVVHKTKLENVPVGPVIVIEPQSDSNHWTIGPDIEHPIVAKQNTDSPLMAHVRLQNVMFVGAKELQFAGEAIPLLENANDLSFYASIPREDGDALVLSISLAEGDLPLRIAFPVMMKNAVESFLSDKDELRPALATGQTMLIDFGNVPHTVAEFAEGESNDRRAAAEHVTAEKTRQLLLRSPRGQSQPISAAGTAIHLGPFDQAGMWLVGPKHIMEQPEVDLTSDDIVAIAVNLANPAESDLYPRGELVAAPQVSFAWGGYSLWFYLSLYAVVGICIEWFLYQRRIVA